MVSSSLQPLSYGPSSTLSTWMIWLLGSSRLLASLFGLSFSHGDTRIHGVGLPCSILLPSTGLDILGGMQNSGMVSGVMMFGHSKTLLALSMDDLSPNMMSPILKLYSVMGIGRLVLSTDTLILSTTHMGSQFGLRVETLQKWKDLWLEVWST